MEAKCSVVSFIPWAINEEKPGLVPARFHIPESDTKVPEVLVVSSCFHYVYLDDSRGHLRVVDPPDEVARSIVNDFVDSQLQVTPDARPAIFWVVGEYSKTDILIKFSAECKEVLRKQLIWFQSLCRLADDDWNKYHAHSVVSSVQRKVANLLGLDPKEHAWMSTPVSENLTTCPSCGNRVSASAAVCLVCRCVIDAEKHKKLQFA